MKRDLEAFLDTWLTRPTRRPLVLRGARQVGKTWLVRELARRSGRRLVEVNFERDPGLRRAFAATNPVEILADLSLALGGEIRAESALLFLDEIQAAGEVLARLRWFAEELPALPVIAAGSLLEFTLADHGFSMPVGRVSFRHVEPMSFPEYLDAHDQGPLRQALAAWRPGGSLSAVAHDRASSWFHRYSMVGGMPAVVTADVAGRGGLECRDVQRDLVATYRADFAKYSGRMATDVLDLTLRSVAATVGQKLVYAQADAGVKAHHVKRALDLLALARVVHVVRWSAGHGVPLGAESKDTFRKAILGDVGLMHALLGTPAGATFPKASDLPDALSGRLAEQLVGQQLRQLDSGSGDGPELWYWQRDGGRSGEVDYLVQLHSRVVPVEVKAGAAGAMKSLHQFMSDRALNLAIRCDSNAPTVFEVDVLTTLGQPARYRLVSVPHYLVWNLEAIVGAAVESAA